MDSHYEDFISDLHDCFHKKTNKHYYLPVEPEGFQ